MEAMENVEPVSRPHPLLCTGEAGPTPHKSKAVDKHVDLTQKLLLASQKKNTNKPLI